MLAYNLSTDLCIISVAAAKVTQFFIVTGSNARESVLETSAQENTESFDLLQKRVSGQGRVKPQLPVLEEIMV